MTRAGNYILTAGGVRFYPLDPRPDEINVEDIAHALARSCRYTGHCRWFYSVAEHSVRMAEIASPENALACLLHDASEAYLTDIPRPLKELAGFGDLYREAEDKLQAVIAERFGLPYPFPQEVHDLDVKLLVTEQRDLMPATDAPWFNAEPLERRIYPWQPHAAHARFLAAFSNLTRRAAA